MEKIFCQYCLRPAERVTGREIYPHRSDLYRRIFYRCIPCAAYVGCHLGTAIPLGVLANAYLRTWKKRAHAAFDPIWQQRFVDKKATDPRYKKSMARGGRYKKLADLLGINREGCHIGMFTIELCRKTIEICNSGQLN